MHDRLGDFLADLTHVCRKHRLQIDAVSLDVSEMGPETLRNDRYVYVIHPLYPELGGLFLYNDKQIQHLLDKDCNVIGG